MLQGVLEGYNGTVFAYGQTGCGKSFSMQGMDQIAIKIPNPKCRLFLKIDLVSDLAAGVYLSEAPLILGFCLGWYINFVDSGSGKILYNYCMLSIQPDPSPPPPPPTCYTLYKYIPLHLFTQRRGEGW